ncbi:MAG: hypothetical protein AABZ08_02660 [Planctomycetota bacterium]
MTKRPLHQRITERNFLANEAVNAKAAMNQTLHDMKATLSGMISMRTCVKQHPWCVAGSAVAVGFVAGTALTPSRGTNPKKSRPSLQAESQPTQPGHDTAKPRKSFLVSTLGTVLTGILQIWVQGLLAATVVAKDRDESPLPHASADISACENGTV